MVSSPGAYVRVVHLPSPTTICVGGLGDVPFESGLYLYCGSAQGGLMPRLARHMRSDKTMHWHIDHLTGAGQVIGALTFLGGKETECRLAAALGTIPGVEPTGLRFGSSDCRCRTHLFHLRDEIPLSIVVDILHFSFPDQC